MNFFITFHFFKSQYPWYDIKNISAGLIRWRFYSKFNHVAVEVGGRYYQSRAFCGVTSTAYLHEPSKKSIHISVPEFVFVKFKKFLQDQVGIKYDFRAIIGFIINKRIENNKAWFCSELVNQFFVIAEGYYEESKTLISPEALFHRVLMYKKGITRGICLAK